MYKKVLKRWNSCFHCLNKSAQFYINLYYKCFILVWEKQGRGWRLSCPTARCREVKWWTIKAAGSSIRYRSFLPLTMMYETGALWLTSSQQFTPAYITLSFTGHTLQTCTLTHTHRLHGFPSQTFYLRAAGQQCDQQWIRPLTLLSPQHTQCRWQVVC